MAPLADDDDALSSSIEKLRMLWMQQQQQQLDLETRCESFSFPFPLCKVWEQSCMSHVLALFKLGKRLEKEYEKGGLRENEGKCLLEQSK